MQKRKRRFKSGRGFGAVKPMGDDKIKLEDLVDVIKLTKRYTTLRFMPTGFLARGTHWIKIIGSKTGEKHNIPKNCLAVDPINDGMKEDADCPYCNELGYPTRDYLFNVIVREHQENEPIKKGDLSSREARKGLKDKGSQAWTPVRIVRLPPTVVAKIADFAQLNVHNVDGSPEPISVDDEEFGVDIQISFDNDKKGSDKYSVMKTETVRHITDEEADYLRWDIEDERLYKAESFEEASKSLEGMNIVPDDKDDNSSNSPAKSGISRSVDMGDLELSSEESVDLGVTDSPDDFDDAVTATPASTPVSKPQAKPTARKAALARRKAVYPSSKFDDDDDLGDAVPPHKVAKARVAKPVARKAAVAKPVPVRKAVKKKAAGRVAPVKARRRKVAS